MSNQNSSARHHSLNFATAIGLCCFCLLSIQQPLAADEWTIRTADGTETISASAHGSAEGVKALMLPDGSIRLEPSANIIKRVPMDGLALAAAEEMSETLKGELGGELVLTLYDEPFLVALVLSDPLDRRDDRRAAGFLKKAVRFQQNVNRVFERFADEVDLKLTEPEFPLVMLVFESDDDFEAYATEATGGRGLSASSVLGFYSGITNRLALRLTECDTFEVPLHEAIHQFVYNRGLAKRLAPVPSWWNEGIATGFENNGETIGVGPGRISADFAERAQTANSSDWNGVVSGDTAFRRDSLAGDAYTHAWSLHWYLVTQHRKQYADFVRSLGQLEPLTDQTPESRLAIFQRAFKQPPNEMQSEFPRVLSVGLRRQRVRKQETSRRGWMTRRSNLARVEINAGSVNGGPIRVHGAMKNISPIRSMSFVVRVETDGGLYADWHVPNLAPGRTMKLLPQNVQKAAPGAIGVGGTRFGVAVETAVPDSPEAKNWAAGDLPVPVFSRVR
ncbi:DUF1570 domain-containing protein [Stratiformator vulcanicus]|uniref:DUF1570 domain-containing protein n=1 Tax=Stratiformator vulcanicus TaxID=2527980 RepID=A0A517R2P8_9PLAN|nr:DUF1570 domain-containing protein [Stratiformator vulcanicus]QDT38123.1 hypothetical protein Pan189_25130 [Stratiformator vulcanicus]